MNNLFVLLGIESWKPLLTALALPPVPLLLLVGWGVWRAKRQRSFGLGLAGLGLVALWLSHCAAGAHWVQRWLLDPPPQLGMSRIEALRGAAQKRDAAAIVILGSGSESLAPEYGTSNLTTASIERLRYGLWLARATAIPVAFSGGVGWGQVGTQTEAEAAGRIARLEFNSPLRWAEAESRDTRENAVRSIALLRRAGVKHVLLVTHDWHMPRALRDFRRAAQDHGIEIEAAPMGLAHEAQLPSLHWLPSGEGAQQMRRVLREALGLLMGA